MDRCPYCGSVLFTAVEDRRKFCATHGFVDEVKDEKKEDEKKIPNYLQ